MKSNSHPQLILSRVTRQHFAFFKGYLERIDLRTLASQYLETCDSESIDMRVIQSTIDWILHEFKILTKKEGSPSLHRLLRIAPEKLESKDQKVPSLEEYKEEVDPYEMYSEAELIELFTEAYPDTEISNKSKRNERLRKKQFAALNWLQELVLVDPNPDDLIDAWLKPNITKKLKKSGINTIRELINAINSNGYFWFNLVPGFGELSAKSVLKWISANQEYLNQPISIHSLHRKHEIDYARLRATTQKTFSIRPMEYYLPQNYLDGSQGENRADKNKSGVNSDLDAINLWLSTYEFGSNTYLSYRSQAERFLLWSIFEREKPISSLNTSDCIAYKEFLNDLGKIDLNEWSKKYRTKESDWLGKRNTERFKPNWKPFEELKPLLPPRGLPKLLLAEWKIKNTPRIGVLKPSSQKQALVILSTLCNWLVKRRYLDSNPWDGIFKRNTGVVEIATHHSFTIKQWEQITEHLSQLPESEANTRLKFIIYLGYFTGLRLSEMKNAKKADLQYYQSHDGNINGWILTVIGKGKVKRQVPFPTALLRHFDEYLQYRGFNTIHDLPSSEYLICHNSTAPSKTLRMNSINSTTHQVKPLHTNSLYTILKDFFSDIAMSAEFKSIEDRNHFTNASTHWLRHTCGTHLAAKGVSVEIIQGLFGHSSLKTSGIYIKPELELRIKTIEDASANSK